MTTPSIAVIGGGINGCGAAWELARRDYRVTLFEKKSVGSATSSATTKMVHGGLRYLETFQIGLVRESLRERAFLLERIPDLVRPLEIVIPHYASSARSRLEVEIGLTLYDSLAGRRRIARHARLTRDALLDLAPLRPEGLRGGFVYSDAQVDDLALVRRVAASAARDGATIRENARVSAMRRGGDGWLVECAGEEAPFDLVVVIAGPWMNEFLAASRIATRYALTLVRGSHIILSRTLGPRGFLLESPGEKRVFFALPWKGQTLVGTTEVAQQNSLDEVNASAEEIDYLIERFNRYFTQPATRDEIAGTFAGVRALVGSKSDLSRITREYRIETADRLVNVFGGKLTTFMSLARKVADRVDAIAGQRRPAREPRFV